MTKYFITGGAGFIGSHTVDALVAEGEGVTVYDKLSFEDAKNLHHQKGKITYIQGDICDYKFLLESMNGHTQVLHLAAIVSVPESLKDPFTAHAVNVTGTVHVFEAARQCGVSRVVYASSAAVYGNAAIPPVHEDVPCVPQSPYALHKVENEQYAALMQSLYGLSTMGLRYFNVYGTRQRPDSAYSGVITIFMNRMKKGETLMIYGDGSATRDFVHVRDIARANIAALHSEHCDVCNIGTGTAISLNELIDTIEERSGCACNRVYESPREGDILHSCASVEKSARLLNYVSRTSFTDGIRELIEAFH